MSLSTLGGATVISCSVQIPAYGCWWADVELDAVTLSGSVDFVLADLALRGTIVSGGVLAGRAHYRIVAGSGGWGRALPRRAYANDAGVRLARVLIDAAVECGETIGYVSTASLGPAWTREAGPASESLALLVPRGWHVDAAGVTQIYARVSTPYTGPLAAMTGSDAAMRRLVLAVDTIATLVPGLEIPDWGRVVDVQHQLRAGGLRSTLWFAASPTGGSRLADALQSVLDSLHASVRCSGLHEYRVVSHAGERLNLQCARVATGLPDLRRVPVRLAPGTRATWALGSLCLVAFVDGSPARPVVVAGDDPDSPGWLPTELTLCDATDAALGVARLTDTVIAGPFAGTITSASQTFRAGA